MYVDLVDHSNLTEERHIAITHRWDRVDLSIYEAFLYTVVQNHLRGPHLSNRVSVTVLTDINLNQQQQYFIILIVIFLTIHLLVLTTNF